MPNGSLLTEEAIATPQEIETAERVARVDASIARQLRDSMEANARMCNRLGQMVAQKGCPPSIIGAIAAIISDRDPELS